MDVLEEIRVEMFRQKISKTEMAKRIGKTEPTVHQAFKEGADPKFRSVVEAIAKELGMKIIIKKL